MRKTQLIAVAVAAAALLGLGTATAASADTVANEAGPITSLTTNPDLSCSADVSGTPDAPVLGVGANCQTLVASGGTLNTPEGYWLTGEGLEGSQIVEQVWAPISQTNTGSGTILDPFVITTVVSGDEIQLTQIDTYASGRSSYSTAIEVENTGNEAATPIIYRIADCAVEEYGYLSYAAPSIGDGSPVCRSVAGIPTGQWGEGTTAGDDYSQLVPLTAGSKFRIDQGRGIQYPIAYEQEFDDVVLFPDSARDNIQGLSWKLDLAPGASSTVAFQTHYSADGHRAVPSTLAASESVAGESTVTVSFGAADAPVTLSGGMSVTLPAGASYVAGSSSIGEPMVVGDVLIFTAPIGSTDSSFTFRVSGGEAGVTDELKLTGSTQDGVDFVEATSALQIEAHTPEPTETPAETPTATPTASATATPSATPAATPSATATPAATATATSASTSAPTSTPTAGGLATTGVDSDLAPLGIGAGVVLLLGAALAVFAVRRRAQADQS